MYIWAKHIKVPTNAPIEHRQVVNDIGTDMAIWSVFVFTLSVTGTWLLIFAIIYALWRLFIKALRYVRVRLALSLDKGMSVAIRSVKWNSIYGLRKRTNLHKNL